MSGQTFYAELLRRDTANGGNEFSEPTTHSRERQRLKHSLTSMIAEDRLAYPEIWSKWDMERIK